MRRIAALALLSVLSACGQLHVKVDVIDPGYLDAQLSQAELRRQLNLALGQTDDQVRQVLLSVRNEHEAIMENKAAAWRALLAETPENEQPILQTTIDRYTVPNKRKVVLDRIYPPAIAAISAANGQVREVYNALDPQVRSAIQGAERPIKGQLLGVLADREAVIAGQNASIANHIGALARLDEQLLAGVIRERAGADDDREGAGESERETADPAVAELQRQVQLNLSSLTGGQTLVDDELAFAVADAPEKSWAEYYNETLASGSLGDFDVAVKLESLSDFTIKGISFDPSTVAQVAAKVTTQALLVAAQVAGVPVSSAPSTGDGTALATASGELAAMQEQFDQSRALIEDYRVALLDLGAAITRESMVIEGTDDEARKRAAAAVKLAFDNLKDRLALGLPLE